MRELAPVSDAAWAQIMDEAKKSLSVHLAARRVVDFAGPRGWRKSAVKLGRVAPSPPVNGVETGVRQVQPLVELRVPFNLGRRELETIGRGAHAADLTPVTEASRKIALAEDCAVFRGYQAGGIEGIFTACHAQAVELSEDYEQYPHSVAQALYKLRTATVAGPYALALGPRCFAGLTQTLSKGGYPLIELVRRQLDGGPIIWAPMVDGALVVSLRGGDFLLTVGQDYAIGYLSHSENDVTLYIQESFTFVVYTQEAAVPLLYNSPGGGAPKGK